MVKLDKEISLITNVGDCEDIVSHTAGFQSIDMMFIPGLSIPIITIVFNLLEQGDIRCFKQGEKANVILGVENGDIYINGTVLKTDIIGLTQHYTLKVSIAVGLDFTNEFLSYYRDGTSLDALSGILSKYFEVSNEAASTSDSMTWLGYGVAKRLAMNYWLRSWYGGSNYLLAGIDYNGARLIDVAKASSSKKWKLGPDEKDDASVDAVSLENRRPLVQDGLDRDILSDAIIKPMEYKLYDDPAKTFMVSGVHDWRAGRRRIIEAQYGVHDNWSRALAFNTSYLSILRPVVSVTYQGFVPIRMFDAIDLDVTDPVPQLELSGRYLAGPMRFSAADGKFTTTLGLMREEVAL